jgi:hypothetical protein
MKPDGASECGDLEVDIVTNLELEISMPIICVTLLSALSNSQALSHLCNSFFGLLDLYRAKE